MPVTTPPLIPQPFAQSGDRAAIPNTTAVLGRASYAEGFPAETMQPKVAGGVPPDGRDMNGILYALSAHAAYVQAGQPYLYDAAVAAAIGGYGIGTILGSADGSTIWLNLTAANSTDPDASGAGWIPIASYGFSPISGLVGGTRILTRAEARYGTLVLSGTLVANQNIVLPTDLREWRIVNLTTGSFTTTVKTSGGVGVPVPQGGYAASVGVYCNGTEIFLEVPPVALPIAVSPDPNTLAKRDNAGDIFARFFNAANPNEAFAVASVMASNGSDNYLRRISFANFIAQVLANAALSGNPTAPTQAAGNNSTRIATTAYVDTGLAAVLAAALGGPAQTWQDVNGSRTINTDYTNSTGRPIQVSVCFSLAAFQYVQMTVNGVQVAYNQAGTSAEVLQACFIVPAGAVYRANSAGAFVQDSWSELR